MSNYCTNCKWLGKETNAGRTNWFCRKKSRNGIQWNLASLYGNPTKLLQCINENWYETKNKSEVSKLVTEHGRAMQFVVDKILEQREKKMKTEDMIKVMQAYIDRKQIEVAKRGEGNGYQPLLHETWDFINYHYRIKPEPKYRPLNNNEMKLLVGTVIVDNNTKDVLLVICAREDLLKVKVNTTRSWYDAEHLLKYSTYVDGTPVGKLEE